MDKKRIIAAGGLVFNEQEELLMIFRRGFWDLPKGKLDKGETIEQCAIREVEEETGIRNITVIRFISITLHEYFDTYLDENVIKESHWFHMTVKGHQILVPQTEEDISIIKWVSKAQLPEYLNNTYPNIESVLKTFFSTQQP
ncbi:MAG: NUDIX domain-containing protein [Sediminibacterium sp.]|nr:MAG: hypothetical protein FD183_1392 [Chitinophagaceae bacterium]MDP1843543.1 NUDIX domain-containing protein [Sediminibacterium sp.]TXT33586.1 MAG: NUDIX hydrolase [Chitinophagaceae bacterium]